MIAQQNRMESRTVTQNVTFKPSINTNSQKIFSKMVADNKIQVGQSYEDYLISRGKQYEQKRQNKQAEKDMADLENRECTFMPQVQGSSRQGDQARMGHSHSQSANKWEELYTQAERKRGKQDRNHDEIEFERNQHEMRFAPEIHEVNTRGLRKPIVAKSSAKKGVQAVH